MPITKKTVYEVDCSECGEQLINYSGEVANSIKQLQKHAKQHQWRLKVKWVEGMPPKLKKLKEINLCGTCVRYIPENGEIAVQNTSGRYYYLGKNAVRNSQITKAKVRRAFVEMVPIGTFSQTLGYTSVLHNGGSMQVGCSRFGKDAVAVIRHWAGVPEPKTAQAAAKA